MKRNSRLSGNRNNHNQLVFRLMLIFIAVVFAMFYMIGYTHFSEETPQFNSPLLTGLLIVVMIMFVVGTLALMAWSALRKSGSGQPFWKVTENLVPKGRIVLYTVGGVALLLIVTYLFGSTDTMLINGQPYSQKGWLRLANMFIASAIVMLVACVAAIVINWLRNRRNQTM